MVSYPFRNLACGTVWSSFLDMQRSTFNLPHVGRSASGLTSHRIFLFLSVDLPSHPSIRCTKRRQREIESKEQEKKQQARRGNKKVIHPQSTTWEGGGREKRVGNVNCDITQIMQSYSAVVKAPKWHNKPSTWAARSLPGTEFLLQCCAALYCTRRLVAYNTKNHLQANLHLSKTVPPPE